MPNSPEQFVIIGAGQAGFSIAAGLRKRNTDALITIIGAENSLPYQRPPLSKKFLLGELPAERLLFKGQDWYDNQRINVISNMDVCHIQRDSRYVACDDGTRISYDRLALATGARARPLPTKTTGGAKNVFSLRTIEDILAIQPLMQAGKRLLIVGGGYIGLEAAAVARKIGLEVTILEASKRILGRVAAPETSDFFRNLHQAHGVEVLEATALDSFIVNQGFITGAQCGKTALECDLVLVGIGVIPNDEIASSFGIATDQGILVDEYGQTNDPMIYAAGDCARFAYRGETIRLESVQNANDQGDCIAANMLGEQRIYDPKPWFWSDQYDIKLQIAGLNQGYDTAIKRKGKREGAQSVWYFKDKELLAVDAMNDALAYGIGKKLIDADKTLPQEAVEDSNSNLKDYV